MTSVNRVVGKPGLLEHLMVVVIKQQSSEHPQQRSALRFPRSCKIHPGLCQPVRQLKNQRCKRGVSKQNRAQARGQVRR